MNTFGYFDSLYTKYQTESGNMVMIDTNIRIQTRFIYMVIRLFSGFFTSKPNSFGPDLNPIRSFVIPEQGLISKPDIRKDVPKHPGLGGMVANLKL